MLFGKNPNTEILLAILGLKESQIERFRDCGFTDDGIYIYTRTGGGNREDYPNKELVNSPYYLKDEDDEGDCTYAQYYFKFPDEIKDDCIQFMSVRENGISGKLIQWILKILEREETKEDKHHRLWIEQNKLVQQSKQTFIFETNGHTIVPLDESSLEKYLTLMEENEGNQLSYSVMPYKIIVEENVDMWSNLDRNKPELEKQKCRVKISFPKSWEIDQELWKRWEEKYKSKFPKSIAKIKENIN